MSSRRRAATTIAGMVLAIGLAGCGGDDKAEQSGTSTDTTTTTDTSTGTGAGAGGSGSTSAPAATMDPGMDHSKMPGMEGDMPGMNH
jgi:hypothetical protein